MAQLQASFIPKKSPVQGEKTARGAHANVTLFTLIGIIIFLAGIGLSTGVFVYERVIRASIDRKTEDLEKARAAFEPELIKELSRLDVRMQAAKDLLSQHTAVSEVFDLLEQSTLKNIRYNSFSYGGRPNGFSVDIAGIARSFSSVALQSDEYAKNPDILAPIISNFTLDDTGNVSFSLKANVTEPLISYERSLGTPVTAEARSIFGTLP